MLSDKGSTPDEHQLHLFVSSLDRWEPYQLRHPSQARASVITERHCHHWIGLPVVEFLLFHTWLPFELHHADWADRCIVVGYVGTVWRISHVTQDISIIANSCIVNKKYVSHTLPQGFSPSQRVLWARL